MVSPRIHKPVSHSLILTHGCHGRGDVEKRMIEQAHILVQKVASFDVCLRSETSAMHTTNGDATETSHCRYAVPRDDKTLGDQICPGASETTSSPHEKRDPIIVLEMSSLRQNDRTFPPPRLALLPSVPPHAHWVCRDHSRSCCGRLIIKYQTVDEECCGLSVCREDRIHVNRVINHGAYNTRGTSWRQYMTIS